MYLAEVDRIYVAAAVGVAVGVAATVICVKSTQVIKERKKKGKKFTDVTEGLT